ncbi:ACP S-malonyltransferase [Streptococcus pneumoniae]|nr:ACP S-malonyltransferase [Streptococcus pneumoniae]
MTKTAFLFAGQGAQYLGMGRDFYDQYPIVKETIDRASQVLGYDLRYLIDTEEDKLNQTRYTQPAILATSVVSTVYCKKRAISLIWLLVCLLENTLPWWQAAPWILKMRLPW